MPIGNNFQHAAYSRSDPGDRVGYRDLIIGAPPGSLAWQDAMAAMGTQLVQGGVRLVVFLHGTALGTDLFGMQRLDEVGGLKRGYSRGIAGLDALLALMREETNGVPALKSGPRPPFTDDDPTKHLIDEQAGDAANFSHAYVELFRKAINRSTERSIRCERLLWSCEHHHIGRSQAALQVISRLHALVTAQNLGPGDHVLVQAHGQAGLLMALASNLLAPHESASRASLLQTLKDYAIHTRASASAIELLEQSPAQALNGATLDVVTLGTPVRYGWDPAGLGKLLHILNHRPMRVDGKRWLAKMELPQITMEMPIAWGGDYVQQLAVGGTDALPTSPEAKVVNKVLWELLEPYEGFERWLECTRKSVRCHNDGQCLLVDYKDSTATSTVKDHIYGHAAYTRMNAMLFNTTEIVRNLYPSAGL
ncbi:MAG TPA: hypothetical protein VFI05_08275 [Nitrospiraceae bacterium]|nr:hypothetical protein [Nitrospiraceae bacterium]